MEEKHAPSGQKFQVYVKPVELFKRIDGRLGIGSFVVHEGVSHTADERNLEVI